MQLAAIGPHIKYTNNTSPKDIDEYHKINNYIQIYINLSNKDLDRESSNITEIRKVFKLLNIELNAGPLFHLITIKSASEVTIAL